MKIKNIFPFILMFLSSILHSQIINKEIKEPNYFMTNNVLFEKNTWKPFSGNIRYQTEFKNEEQQVKTKFKNGFVIIEEYTNIKTNKLTMIRKIDYSDNQNIEIYDTIKIKPVFKKSEKYIETIKLQSKMVFNYYYKNEESKKIEKLNGYITYENTKLYFINGIKVKVEYFYDIELKKIKESYEIFHTTIGNIDNGDIKEYKTNFIFDGEYQKWDLNQKLIESGKYLEGKKI